ncbi:MAG: hypothetical protein ABGW90_08965 [Martelella sp.]
MTLRDMLASSIAELFLRPAASSPPMPALLSPSMAVRDTILPEKIPEMKKWVRETLWSHKKKEPPEWRLGQGMKRW